MKLRILEVNKAYYPHIGGIETLVRQYSEELGKLPEVSVKTLVCRDGIGKTIRRRVNGSDIIYAGSVGTYFSCPVSLSFIRLFRKMSANADAVHIHFPFPLADLALLLSGYRGKVIVSWHSDIVSQRKLMFLYKRLLKYLLRRADMILAATKGHIIYSDVLPAYKSKCRILPYGIRPEEYGADGGDILTKLCTGKNSVKLLFTGRLVYYKGCDILIKAVSLTDGCELFIVGEGELKNELISLAEELNVRDRVHFLGSLTDSDLKKAYSDCDIFVLPSVKKSEAFGIVQLEAMASGKPVINTRLRSGVPYVSIDGKTGLTVRPSDEKALADALRKLIRDRQLRETFGGNGRKRVRDMFSENETIRKLYSLISEGIT